MAALPGRLAALLLLLPLAAQTAPPPPGDLTAIYKDPKARDALRIEIAANGDMRIQQTQGRYLLSHDGHDYLVTAGPGGPVVMRVEDIAAARTGEMSAAGDPELRLAAGEDVVIGGRTGTVYSPDPRPAGGPPIVISRDPALAPIGRAFSRRLELEAVLSRGPGTESAALRSVLASGTPLRLDGADLQSIRAGPIPASRFALPATPETPERVREHWGPRDSEPEPQPVTRTTFKRAIFADGRLWLLSDAGKLVTIAPGDKTPADQPAPEPVLDLCLAGGAPVAVTGTGGQWTIRRFENAAWTTVETVAANGDALVALSCAGGRRTLLTDKRLIDGPRAVRLSEPLHPGVVASTWDDGSGFHVGINAGEWGGGLRRVDRATGAVTTIERSGADLCDGPLNTACDAVNGIAAEPGKPGCLLVAIGVVHFTAHGRLTEICGDRIAPVYYKPYTLEVSPRLDLAAPEPFLTVAFFGLAESRGALWAVGLDGVYRIGAGADISFRKMPRFENIGGVQVSFDIPELVLVLTSINQRVSLSGAVPMLVPR
ncbi:MAG: hypothetical protein V4574_21025 [Pseudomonadota bacterium]